MTIGVISVSLMTKRSLAPYVGPIADWENTCSGLSYHGNCVAMGRFVGARFAEMAMGQSFAVDLPHIMRIPPQHFPFGMARRGLLYRAYQANKFKDRG